MLGNENKKAPKIQCFELGIFSFNSYICYLTRDVIASTRAFNLLTRAFNLPTRTFSVLTHGFELVTRGFELTTRNSCFTFPRKYTSASVIYSISR